MNSLGIYLHIPFCRNKCDYCSFYSVPVNRLSISKKEALYDQYMDRILNEIAIRHELCAGHTVDTIYFGGGTPSLLSPSRIAKIIEYLHACFPIDSKTLEVTLECNPEDVDTQRLSEYAAGGVNRMILGVQTINKQEHSFIGRSSPLVEKRILDDFFAQNGISHGVDLIVGIPGQTEQDSSASLNSLLEYQPEHISAYLLSIEKGTKLAQKLLSPGDMDALHRKIFNETERILVSRGYRHYEISNFALPSCESKHNQKYWNLQPYLGIGAAAHSFYGKRRFYNTMTVDEYLDLEPDIVEDKRDLEQEIAEFFLTGLRQIDGISSTDFGEYFTIPIPDNIFKRAEKLKRKGFLEIEHKSKEYRISLTREGLFLMDSILLELLEEYV